VVTVLLIHAACVSVCLELSVTLVYGETPTSAQQSAVAEMGDRLATIDIGRKEGGCCALLRGEGSWVPSNTM